MKRNTALGGAAWLALAAFSFAYATRLHTIELLFLLGPLVIVPLGFELAARVLPSQEISPAGFLAHTLQFPAALCAAASFFLRMGTRAALLAFPWLLFAAALAPLALWDLLRSARRGLPMVAIGMSRIYLAVGCAWLVASRLGLNPMGFQEPIVLLTAVHFHFAGFAAPLLALAVGAAERRGAESGVCRRVCGAITAGVLSGPGLLAAGFVAGPRPKLAAALVVALSEAALAAWFLAKIRFLRPRMAQVLIALSAVSVLAGMTLAGLWAMGEFPLQPFVHLDEMARYHGTLNGIGFILCGLAGWSLALCDPKAKGGCL